MPTNPALTDPAAAAFPPSKGRGQKKSILAGSLVDFAGQVTPSLVCWKSSSWEPKLFMYTHKLFIQETYALAKSAAKKGNHPFGALLVIDNQVVLKAENSVITDRDVTRHAELNLVSYASRKFSSEELSRSILYTSTEPCAMCTPVRFPGQDYTKLFTVVPPAN